MSVTVLAFFLRHLTMSKQWIMPRNGHLRFRYTKPGGNENENTSFASERSAPATRPFLENEMQSRKEGHGLCQGHPDVDPRPGAPPAFAPAAWGPLWSWRSRSTPSPPRASQPAVSRRVVFRPRLACVPCWRPPRACFLEGTAPS